MNLEGQKLRAVAKTPNGKLQTKPRPASPIMHIRFLTLFLLALVCASPARAVEPPQPGEPATHLYIALFGVTIGPDSQVQNFHLIKVLEPLTSSNNPVNLDFPPGYLESAKKQVEAAHLKPTLKDGKPSETLTAFLHVPHTSQTTGSSSSEISLGSLDGTMAEINSFELKGIGCQSSMFGKPFGASVLFFTYYAVPLPKGTAEDRENAINAEIARCLANFGGAKVLSKKTLPLGDQSIAEVLVKSPKSKILTLRCRLICTAREMLALTTVTPDDTDAAMRQTLDKMFDAFRFR